MAAWAFGSASQGILSARGWLGEYQPQGRTVIDDVEDLAEKLSKSSSIYLPGSEEFERASTRWSNLELPVIDIVVVPGTDQDVAETVRLSPTSDPLCLFFIFT